MYQSKKHLNSMRELNHICLVSSGGELPFYMRLVGGSNPSRGTRFVCPFFVQKTNGVRRIRIRGGALAFQAGIESVRSRHSALYCAVV